ncbi:MAG TPA: hypothetical protein VFH41_00525 [Bradyrhizobium sp.]|nr:hypothetical protein [Bradyrhizobium sp.]
MEVAQKEFAKQKQLWVSGIKVALGKIDDIEKRYFVVRFLFALPRGESR